MTEPLITPGPAADSWPALQDLTRDNLAMLCDYAGSYPDETLHALCAAVRETLRAERAYLDVLLLELQNYREMTRDPEFDDLPFGDDQPTPTPH